jgi:heptosyltransferase-1
VAVDTSFAHLASVMGVPVVGIYAATSMIKVGVLGDNCNNIQSKYHCSPCLSRVCLEYNAHLSTIKQPCLQEITPEIVLAKLEEIMC